jgi:hypothetical protein
VRFRSVKHVRVFGARTKDGTVAYLDFPNVPLDRHARTLTTQTAELVRLWSPHDRRFSGDSATIPAA